MLPGHPGERAHVLNFRQWGRVDLRMLEPEPRLTSTRSGREHSAGSPNRRLPPSPFSELRAAVLAARRKFRNPSPLPRDRHIGAARSDRERAHVLNFRHEAAATEGMRPHGRVNRGHLHAAARCAAYERATSPNWQLRLATFAVGRKFRKLAGHRAGPGRGCWPTRRPVCTLPEFPARSERGDRPHCGSANGVAGRVAAPTGSGSARAASGRVPAETGSASAGGSCGSARTA